MIYIANKELIGTLINKLRKEAHIKQTYLAERIGVKKTAVCQWEKGVTIPDIDKMMQLAVYFGVSVEELLEGKLKTESFEEFGKRNTKKNVDEYLEEMSKNFYELVPGWVDGALDAGDKKRFDELKERFEMLQSEEKDDKEQLESIKEELKKIKGKYGDDSSEFEYAMKRAFWNQNLCDPLFFLGDDATLEEKKNRLNIMGDYYKDHAFTLYILLCSATESRDCKDVINMFIEEGAFPLFYRKPVARETIKDLKGEVTIDEDKTKAASIVKKGESLSDTLDYHKYLLLRDETILEELEELVS